MNMLLKGKLPGIFPVQSHLNELKSRMDEEVLRRNSFNQQQSLYMEIQELECVIKQWQFKTAKQFDPVND